MSLCRACKPLSFAEFTANRSGSILYLRVIFRGKPCCDRDIDNFHRQLDAFYKKKLRMKILYDISQLGWINPIQIPRQITRIKSHDEQNQKFSNQIAIVIIGQNFIRSCLGLLVDKTSKRIFESRSAANKWLGVPTQISE